VIPFLNQGVIKWGERNSAVGKRGTKKKGGDPRLSLYVLEEKKKGAGTAEGERQGEPRAAGRGCLLAKGKKAGRSPAGGEVLKKKRGKGGPKKGALPSPKTKKIGGEHSYYHLWVPN